MTSPPVERHQCFVCSKTYERSDHLKRHLRSHENFRHFQCQVCKKGFNRADLLRRHKLSHKQDPLSQRDQRYVERAFQACAACIAAKTKCGNEKPCKRCKARGLNCILSGSGARPDEPASAASSIDISISGAEARSENSAPAGSLSRAEEIDAQPLTMLAMPTIQNQASEANHLAFPDFIDQIMQAHEPAGHHYDIDRAYSPPTVSYFASDVDFTLTDFDYLAIESEMFGDLLTAEVSATQNPAPQNDALTPLSSGNRQLGPRIRSEAFRKSPWISWHPRSHHHTFTDQEEIDAGGSSVQVDDSPLSMLPDSCIIGLDLDQDVRDKILGAVMRIYASRFSVPSFPSLDLLNSLIRIFFAQECLTICSSVHAATFSPSKARSELLLGMIVVGAIATSETQIQKMGLVIHEVLRMATSELFESDNSSTRDIQALQAYMKWLEVGVWSGIKRKTEIACAFTQPLYMMLYQKGAFGRSIYARSMTEPNDDPAERDRTWRHWVEEESLKRLAICLFIHDSQVSMAYLQPPVLSYANMNLPVPQTIKLWLSPDTNAWTDNHLSINGDASSLALRDVFSNLSVLDEYRSHVDIVLCCFAAVHALANQVSELRQQTVLIESSYSPKRQGLELWCRNRSRDLYEELLAARLYCERAASHYEINLLLEYVMMSLHVSLLDIQCFAGKDGEAEIRRSVPILREWAQESMSRTAVWHAGQVLKMARSFPPSTLRNFYAVGTYHAVLTLWVYSMISKSERQSGTQTPNIAGPSRSRQSNVRSHSISPSPLIRLDGLETNDVRAFIVLGYGVPGLCYTGSEIFLHNNSENQRETEAALPFHSLDNPSFIMNTGVEIFQTNFPFRTECLPYLVQNLMNLMGDLGSLSGT